MQIVSTGFLFGRYKELPSMNNIFTCTSFFSCLFVSFHHTLFVGLREPQKFFLEFSFTCLSNHSLISLWISAKLGSALPHVCSTCHTVFSLKNTLECVCERLLHCKLIFSITWTPANDLHKHSVRQSILMYHSVMKVKKIVGLKLSFKVASAYMSIK